MAHAVEIVNRCPTLCRERLTLARMYMRPGISFYQKNLRRSDLQLKMIKQTSAISISLRPNAANDISTGDPSIIPVAREEWVYIPATLNDIGRWCMGLRLLVHKVYTGTTVGYCERRTKKKRR
jgi:hypothetical protein